MSKVLKVFVNIILILFILVAAALFVPPLLGVSTVVSQSGMATNIQTGAVAYGISERTADLKAGDRILETDDNSAYIYEITEISAEDETAMVAGAEGDTPEEITLRTTARKVLITVPYIGYVSIAMQTTQGRIVLGLAVALLIVLYVVAEVWSRRDRDDSEDEDDEDEDRFYAGLAEKKKKADRDEEQRFRQKQEMKETGETADDETEELQPSRDETEAAFAAEEEQPEVESRTGMAQEEPENVSDVQDALEAALVNEPMNSQGTLTEPEEPEEATGGNLKPDEIALAIPARSVEDLLQEAYANGEDPKVEKDELTGVTFVDLSDCL